MFAALIGWSSDFKHFLLLFLRWSWGQYLTTNKEIRIYRLGDGASQIRPERDPSQVLNI